MLTHGGIVTKSPNQPEKDSLAEVARPGNIQELKLQNAIDHNKGKLLVLSDTAFKNPLIISRSIVINRDSLVIKAKGNIIFQSDSGFKRPAFVLSINTKNVTIDSVSFKNFSVAISSHDQEALHLKNVRFYGLRHPVIEYLCFF